MKMQKFIFFLIGAITLMMTACSGNDPEMNTPEGAIKGVFSVGKNTKVNFSKGNLCYVVSAKTWSFLPHQYSYLGAVNENINNPDASIDLFGWNTADEPARSSESSADYSGTFKDWGKNAISNGGNKPGLWRTMTQREWSYLLYDRANADKLVSMGNVNGVSGTILLPDNWPSDKMYDNAKDGLINNGDHYYNSNGTNYKLHSYTESEWQAMEEEGAVFLPAAGYRKGTVITYAFGGYWTASTGSTDGAYYLGFGPSFLSHDISNYRLYGQSVRLVRDVK